MRPQQVARVGAQVTPKAGPTGTAREAGPGCQWLVGRLSIHRPTDENGSARSLNLIDPIPPSWIDSRSGPGRRAGTMPRIRSLIEPNPLQCPARPMRYRFPE